MQLGMEQLGLAMEIEYKEGKMNNSNTKIEISSLFVIKMYSEGYCIWIRTNNVEPGKYLTNFFKNRKYNDVSFNKRHRVSIGFLGLLVLGTLFGKCINYFHRLDRVLSNQ